MGLEKYENQTIFIFSASSARVLLHETGRDVGTGGIRCASICLLDYNLWLFSCCGCCSCLYSSTTDGYCSCLSSLRKEADSKIAIQLHGFLLGCRYILAICPRCLRYRNLLLQFSVEFTYCGVSLSSCFGCMW